MSGDSQRGEIFVQPIFNGPISYSLCSNKWCHHVLFNKAKLHSPSTAMISVSSSLLCTSNSTMTIAQLREISQRLLPNDPLPHLIKPNAGGFGNGIIQINSTTTTATAATNTADSSSSTVVAAVGAAAVEEATIVLPVNDDTILLQAYYRSHNSSSNSRDHNNGSVVQTIYRVWFLLGKVQCAVQRTSITTPTPRPTTTNVSLVVGESDDISDYNNSNSSGNEFTSGCSASNSNGTCQYRSGSIDTTVKTTTGTDINKKASPSSSSSASTTTTTTTAQPWEVPNDVRIEMEEQLLPLLCDDAHAGSVEFLIHGHSSDHNNNNNNGGRRYYFDLNLLSTLPIIDNSDQHPQDNSTLQHDNTTTTTTANTGWNPRYNPWSELAQAVLLIMRRR